MNLRRTSNVVCDKCGRKRARKITFYPDGFQRVHCTRCHKSEMPVIMRRMDELRAKEKEILEIFEEATGSKAVLVSVDGVPVKPENEPKEAEFTGESDAGEEVSEKET